MRRNDQYFWPFGLAGYCWRDGRLFYLRVEDIGFIFLLNPVRPTLLRALGITDPGNQHLLDERALPRWLRSDARRAAWRAMTLTIDEEGTSWLQGPLPTDLPELFPNVAPLMTHRRRLIELYLGEQSPWDQ